MPLTQRMHGSWQNLVHLRQFSPIGSSGLEDRAESKWLEPGCPVGVGTSFGGYLFIPRGSFPPLVSAKAESGMTMPLLAMPRKASERRMKSPVRKWFHQTRFCYCIFVKACTAAVNCSTCHWKMNRLRCGPPERKVTEKLILRPSEPKSDEE